jgi:hypothetical protein
VKHSHFALLAVPLCLSTVALAVACSSTPATTDGGSVAPSDASAETSPPPLDAGADAAPPVAEAGIDSGGCPAYTGALPGDAGTQCHDLVSNAPSVTVIADPGTIPIGTGGPVAEGLYYLTEARIFPGSPVPSGTKLKYAVLLAGDMSYVVDDNGGQTVRRVTKKNPDGGAGIILCESKVDNNRGVSTQTSTCGEFTSYDSVSLFSAKFVKQ